MHAMVLTQLGGPLAWTELPDRHPGPGEILTCMKNRFTGNIGRSHGRGIAQLRCSVPCPAPGIEHMYAFCEPRGEAVTGQVLIQKIVIDQAWDDPLASELRLRQHLAPIQDPYQETS